MRVRIIVESEPSNLDTQAELIHLLPGHLRRILATLGSRGGIEAERLTCIVN